MFRKCIYNGYTDVKYAWTITLTGVAGLEEKLITQLPLKFEYLRSSTTHLLE